MRNAVLSYAGGAARPGDGGPEGLGDQRWLLELRRSQRAVDLLGAGLDELTMTTNGTLIDKVKAKRLVEAGLRGVNISIDSPIRKMHEKIRGVEGSFKKTAQAVALFNRYAHKGKLTVRINTVVGRSNFETLATLPDLAHELGADGINLKTLLPRD